jgi:hypothetical protein
VACTCAVEQLIGQCWYHVAIVWVIKSRRMRWGGHVARVGEGRDMYRVLVGKSEGKRSLGRPRHRWEDSIKIDLQVCGM